jgi:hypothetical protein
MVRQTRNIPQGKEQYVSEEERQQAKDYHEVSDNLYHAGINVGKEGAYDPQAGADKHPIRRPEIEPTPVLATDPGQPKGVGANLVERERNKAVDKSESNVVRSSGRKRAATEEKANDEGTGEL